MVISSQLSLIPYSGPRYSLKPFAEEALSFRRDHPKAEVRRYDLFQHPKFDNHFTQKNQMHATYGTGNQIKSPKFDQLGLLVDIYA